MQRIFTAIWRLFISRKFAVGLLIIIVALLIPGILLPTSGLHTPEEMEMLRANSPILARISEIFHPLSIAGSWTFILLNAALLISTILCSIERIRNRQFKDPHGREPAYSRETQVFSCASDTDVIASAAQALLRRGRWRVTHASRGDREVIVGRKGDIGFWGSIVFHVGFLALLMGVIVSANTRLSATVLVAEDQAVSPKADGFTSITRTPKKLALPDFRIRLDRVESLYEQGRFATDYRSFVTFIGPEGATTASVGVNEAFTYKNFRFLMENYGYAPSFIVRDKSDKELFNAIVNLKGRDPQRTDSLDIPKADMHIETRFFPDFRQSGPRQAANESLEPRNPAYLIKATIGGKEVFSGPIKLKERVELGEYSLEFAGLRRWSLLRVNQDSGVDVIFWGLAVAVAGLVVRFVLHERSVSIVATDAEAGAEVTLAGKSRYFPALFAEEIEAMARQLKKIEGD